MPPAIVTRHVARMLSGPLSVPVVSGGTTTRGLFDHDVELVDDGMNEVRQERRSVLVATGALPGTVVQNSALTVDGVAYKVRAVLPQEDAVVTRYVLAAA